MFNFNVPFDKFHCICRGYGRLMFYVPFKGWFVKYDNYGFQFMVHSSLVKGNFHNCRVTGVY